MALDFKKGMYRHLDVTHIQNGEVSESGVVYRHLDQSQIPVGDDKLTGGPYRHLDPSHEPVGGTGAGSGGGGGVTPPAYTIVLGTFEDMSANTLPMLGKGSKFAINTGKHSFDRALSGINSPTYDAANNPMYQLASDFRFFHDMQNDDYAASGGTPVGGPPAYVAGGWGRMHNNPLGRLKLAKNLNGDIKITISPQTSIGASPAKGFPEKFWRSAELGGNSFAKYINARAWWDAFLPLYDRTGASEGFLIADRVEFSNEAWSDSIGTDTMLRWYVAAIQSFTAFYGSSDPANWKIKLDTGAVQAYESGGRWGLADYIGNVISTSYMSNFQDVSVHNYSFTDGTVDLVEHPESDTSEFRHLFTMIDYLDGQSLTNPVRATEYGWDSANIGLFAQGAYAIRALLFAGCEPRVNQMAWYEDVDNPNLTAPLYKSSGLFEAVMPNRYQGAPKTVFKMLVQLKNIIGDATVTEIVRQGDACVAILESLSTSDKFVAIWKPESVNGQTAATVETVNVESADLAALTFGDGYLIDGEGLTFDADMNTTDRGTVIDTGAVTDGALVTTLKIANSMVVYEV